MGDKPYMTCMHHKCIVHNEVAHIEKKYFYGLVQIFVHKIITDSNHDDLHQYIACKNKGIDIDFAILLPHMNDVYMAQLTTTVQTFDPSHQPDSIQAHNQMSKSNHRI